MYIDRALAAASLWQGATTFIPKKQLDRLKKKATSPLAHEGLKFTARIFYVRLQLTTSSVFELLSFDFLV